MPKRAREEQVDEPRTDEHNTKRSRGARKPRRLSLRQRLLRDLRGQQKEARRELKQQQRKLRQLQRDINSLGRTRKTG